MNTMVIFEKCLIIFLFIFRYADSKPIETEVEGLYGTQDNVTILTGKTFNSTIYNSPNIWLVEFYSSWCGHCQDFAPIFKAFAKDIAEWHGLYRLAVVNCPDALNRDLCSIMNVQGVPDMKVFPPFANPETPVIHIDEHKVETLRNRSVHLIGKFLDDVKWGIPGTLKPSFTSLSFEDVTIFHKKKGNPYYLTLVVGDDPFDIGREVILDMSSCGNITVRKFDTKPSEIEKLKQHTKLTFNDFPVVIIISKDGNAEEIDVKFKRRHFYTYKLQRLPGVGDPKSLPKSISPIGSRRRKAYIDWTKIDRDKVYAADIESGIRYALLVEVASLQKLERDSLAALKEFVGTLALLSDQLAMTDTTKNFIIRLTGWLAGQTEISRSTWLKRIQTVEPSNFLPKLEQRWVGCAPSKPGLRGYPCSLWTIFHSLSVAAYNSDIENVLAVPNAMEGYITNFFSCMDCRKNFVKELSKNPYENRVVTHKDAVLWMWDLHNEVNERLHGAVSEDPNIPKVQFPPLDLCPDCRKEDGSWNREGVIKYVVHHYSISLVSWEFMDMGKIEKAQGPEKGLVEEDLLHHLDEFEDDSFRIEDQIIAGFRDHNEDDKESQENGDLVLESRKEKKKQNSLHIMKHMGSKDLSRRLDRMENEWHSHSARFTDFDASLCFLLWGFSLFFVISMYFFIRRRSILKRSIC